MMKLYVKAASKRESNDRLKTDQVIGYRYSLEGVDSFGLDCLKEKTTIAIYQKKVGGNPVATAYGEYDPAKKTVK